MAYRRNRSRIYDYNYEYGSSYYKPQVNYIGEAIDSMTRRSRRRTLSPPGAKTFSERWAANPFYGRYEPISEYYYKPSPSYITRSAFGRASSIPANLNSLYYTEQPVYSTGARGRSMTRAQSMVRETSMVRGQSMARGQSVARESRARSMTRGRSMTRARSVFDEGYEDSRSMRGGSMYDDGGYYYDPLSDQEWERLLKVASKEERERSIFQMRMSLENPRNLARKKMMQTTLSPGVYQNTLYGTETW